MIQTPPEAQKIRFRSLRHEDLPLLQYWLNQEHVIAGWFSDGSYPPDGYSLEAVTRDFTPDLAENSPISPMIFACHGEPIGYIQLWRVSDFEEYAGEFIDDDTLPECVASFDMFIGDTDYLGQGLLPTILTVFLKEHVFTDNAISCVIINPDSENLRAIRAYEKSGFRHTKPLQTSESGHTSHIMRIDRANVMK